MSDLSVPPISITPRDDGALGVPPDRSRPTPFTWPTPPFAAYPAGQRQSGAEPCLIEGRNGSTTKGLLVSFSPETGVAQVKVGPSRAVMPLRLSQFKRLTLTAPLHALLPAAADPHAAILDHRPTVEYRVNLAGGGQTAGHTIGHVETPYGLFLFLPLDDRGTVQRIFMPRDVYASVEFGRRIGSVLVEEKLATERDVENAAAEQQRLRTQKLGDILVNQQIVAADQLLEAIAQQARMPMVRIGEALLALNLITQAQLDTALEQQKSDRSVPLGELLVRHGLVSRQDLQTALARKMGYPVVDVANFPAEAEAVRRVPFGVAARLNALPLLLRSSRLIVALEDPTQRAVIEELEFVSQAKVVPTLATSERIARTLAPTYERFGLDTSGARGQNDAVMAGGDFDEDDAGKLLESLELQQAGAGDDDDSLIEQSDNSLVRLINSMIIDAHSQGVSDIHLETQPGREKVKVRFRKDGRLRPYIELPHTYRSALIARIKIMCDLDISERRKPQDGKINFSKFSPQHRIELRVATIPTNNGLEDVVMRLLASARPIAIDEQGLSSPNLKRFKTAIERPYGLVLCVGPTGSGKTTTLHSALGHINKPNRKIWTAEDPIEITQRGLRQVQMNAKIDWTFAKALRSFLRADPDVIMVGEIRDQETARMAIEASLTGHLVMTTLHTNSAPETVTRLLDMGMDPFNFADSLLAVLAQRLVRRLCDHCRVSREATPSEIDELLDDYMHIFPADIAPSRDTVLADWQGRLGHQGRLLHHHSPGCTHCEDTGFRGRSGLHELMNIDRNLRRLVQTSAGVEALLRAALAEGMRTLRQDGIEKVLQGVTTIEEVRSTSNV